LYIRKDLKNPITTRIVYKKGFKKPNNYKDCIRKDLKTPITTRIVYKKGFKNPNNYKDCI
jgi:hypothetical protein